MNIILEAKSQGSKFLPFEFWPAYQRVGMKIGSECYYFIDDEFETFLAIIKGVKKGGERNNG